MKMIYGLACLALLLGCSDQKKIRRHDLRGAEQITGVAFTRAEEDTLLEYLEDNLKGYDSARKYVLSNATAPALYFDPKPLGFQQKKRTGEGVAVLDQDVILPDQDDSIAFLPVTALSRLIREGKITSVRLTSIYLNRLKKYGDTLQAVVTITESRALQQAAQADAEIKAGKYRGPLHGIPYGIKDLFSVPDYKTTWGAEPYQDQVLNETAAVVQRLDEAGAVLVAKLVSGALARGDVWFGGKTKNPWDLKQGASGSSAGSGSATAAGLVAFSIGTETLGSILAPSGRCGATGLRPTFGAVSRAGCMTLSWSMDKAGPICRSVEDCALVFSIIKGRNVREEDRVVVDYPFSFSSSRPVTAYKVGYFDKLFASDSSDGGVNNKRVLEELKKLGIVPEPVAFVDSIPFAAFDVILRAEAGAFFDELVRSHRDRLLSEQNKDSRANSLRQARFIPAIEYLQASRHRTRLIEALEKIFSQYDVILAPAQGFRMSMATNLSGQPGLSIPTGFDVKGHPTAMIFYGNLYDEGPMLELAAAYQRATGYENRHPDLSKTAKKPPLP